MGTGCRSPDLTSPKIIVPNQQAVIIPSAPPIVGSRWFRCDFHVHGRGSTDYGNNTDTPEMWLRAAIAAGLDCVAITDHNSGEWVDELKAELQRLRDEEGVQLILFPGVELTVHGGWHLLVLFDPSQGRDHVKSFLTAAGIPNGDQGRLDVQSGAIQDALEAAHRHDGLCILAHANDTRGLLLGDSGTYKHDVVKDPHLHGIELRPVDQCARYRTNYDSGDPIQIADAQTQNADNLSTFAHHAQSRTSGLGQVCFSDNPDVNGHGLNGIAKNSTWIKMSTPDKEGLRLALHDGAMCCEVHDPAQPDRNSFSHPVVERISVTRAYVAGLREPLTVHFSPWLSTIIGGFGSGKSTVVECLRIALQRGSDLERLGPRSAALSSFSDFNKVFNKSDGAGALREDTTISVTYTKDGRRFEIAFQQGGHAEIQAIKDDGSREVEPGNIAQRFPLSIYSQKHIYEIARNPSAMLDIVDHAPEVDRDGWQNKWDELVLRFMAARARIRELRRRQEDIPAFQGRLKDLNDKIAFFENEGNQQTRSAWQQGSQQRAELDKIQKAIQKVTASIKGINSFNELPAMTPDLWAADDASIAIGAAYGDAVRRIRDEVIRLVKEASSLSEEIASDFQKTVAESEWQSRHQAVDDAHTAMLETLKQQGLVDPAQYATLLRERELQDIELQERTSEGADLSRLEHEADTIRQNMLTLRVALTRRRQEFVSNLAQHLKTVKLEIEAFGDAVDWEEQLRTHLSALPSQFESTLTPDPAHLEGGPTDNCRAVNLVEDVYRPGSTPSARQAKIINIQNKMESIHSGAINAEYNGHFENRVRAQQPEVIDRLLFLFPEDRASVSYRADARATWQPISVGSAGQKTAAILTFLLAYGTEPLIIDQPEDDLDNNLIYRLVVEQIKENKQRRQLIVVTHNPNIPVNGDAELIVVMAPIPGGFAQELAGGLQEPAVRQQICEIMEGGEDAFKKRFDRIIGGKA